MSDKKISIICVLITICLTIYVVVITNNQVVGAAQTLNSAFSGVSDIEALIEKHISNNSQVKGEDDADDINIDDQIAKYIDNNPQLIVQSFAKYEEILRQKQLADAKKTINDSQDRLFNDETTPFIGNKDGKIKLVEFFDYSCGYCKRVFPTILKLVEENKEVKVYFKELPILGKNSLLATKASLAVHLIDPDKYLEMHRKLLATRITSLDSIMKIVDDIGVSEKKVRDLMDSDKVNELVEDNKQMADLIGISGTPAFILNDQLIPGAVSYSYFVSAIEKLDL